MMHGCPDGYRNGGNWLMLHEDGSRPFYLKFFNFLHPSSPLFLVLTSCHYKQFNRSASPSSRTGTELDIKILKLNKIKDQGLESQLILWCFILQMTLIQQPGGPGTWVSSLTLPTETVVWLWTVCTPYVSRSSQFLDLPADSTWLRLPDIWPSQKVN